MDSRFWAICCFFNPLGSQQKLRNYRCFRRALRIPLVAVELAWGPFELGLQDAETLIQIREGDLLWQKERLLNLALEHLPPECEWVAWLDADIVFESDEWIARSRRLLETHRLIQPFHQLLHLRPNEHQPATGPYESRRSIAYATRRGLTSAGVFARPDGTWQDQVNCGMAWVARRDAIARHGLYDAMILGMGDRALAAAACGRGEDAVRGHKMNEMQAEHYRAWARGFHKTFSGHLGYASGRVYHLWHGSLQRRRYVERYDDFAPFEFDPPHDLCVAPGGAYRWNRDRPQLHAHVAAYFSQRREDEVSVRDAA